MQSPPRLTDRSTLRHRRRHPRARTTNAMFLHDDARFEIEERLAEVNRTFTDIAVVTGHPEFWAAAFPDAVIVPDDPALDLPAHRFDLIIHALCLHWADDPVGQLVQCRRALRPDGLFLAVSFAGTSLQELRAAMAEAEVEVTGGLSPRVVPMADLRDMGGLLGRAGFALPVADLSHRQIVYRDLFHLIGDLRAMGETNALADRHRVPTPRRLFARAAEIYAARFPAAPEGIQTSVDFVYLTGWAPDASQPKPLRPGSATISLADVLAQPDDTPDGSTDPDA